MNLIRTLFWGSAFILGFFIYVAIMCFSEKKAAAFEVKWMSILDKVT